MSIWMNGAFVGTWASLAAKPDELQYSDEWTRSALRRPLSLSLPLTPGNQPHRGNVVRNYFENLLPDSRETRDRVAARHGLSSSGTFELLAEIGRDCVGAVQLLPEDQTPQDVGQIRGDPLSQDEIAEILFNVAKAPLAPANDEDLRISIAGAQEKTALLRHDGAWCRPLASTPSTHIFKLPLGKIGNLGTDLTLSCENEWLCGRILNAFGLPIATSEIQQFGGQKALVVSRFDRRYDESGQLWRVPQEDFCQVFGEPSWRKCEHDGGPGATRIVKVLEGSQERTEDRVRFFSLLVLFWCLGATDGHAKNFSIFLEPDSRFRLTPSYDVISAWPITGDASGELPFRKLKLAMAVRSGNAHYRIHEIQRRHWDEMARKCALGPNANAIISPLVEKSSAALSLVESEIPDDFPEIVSERILRRFRESINTL